LADRCETLPHEQSKYDLSHMCFVGGAELEDEEEHVINWSVEMTDVLGSRLYALWNRTAGDCLLDSVLQASWGVMDRDNTLRRALADSLGEAAFTYVSVCNFIIHTSLMGHGPLNVQKVNTWLNTDQYFMDAPSQQFH